MLRGLLRDLCHAGRTLRRSPGFFAAATLTLALAIGANATIFSLADALVFHAFTSLDQPDRVLWLFESVGKQDFESDTVEAANFADWRAQTRTLELAALQPADHTLTGGGAPERLSSLAVTAEYFAVLGARPRLGRAFLPAELSPGAPPTAILGEGVWRRRFGADPQVVGRAVEIDGRPTTIVGVFADLVVPGRFELFVPMVLSTTEWRDRKRGAFAALARLRPGVDLKAAQAELDLVAGRLEQRYPAEDRALRVHLVTIPDVFNLRPPMFALLIGVGFVLLIACANVAHLTLARGLSRRRELAVRQAVGASRLGLCRLLVMEAALVALGGALLGISLARLGWAGILGALPPSLMGRLPQLADAGINRRVLGFALLLAIVSTLLSGVLPALRSSSLDLGSALKDGSAGSGIDRRRHRLAALLLVAQVALALVLAAGAGVAMRSFLVQMGRPLGFRSDGLFTLRLPLRARHPDAAGRAQFVDRLLARLGNLPGVSAAAASSRLPMAGVGNWSFRVVGRETRREEQPTGHLRAVSPGFFATLAIPLRRGRAPAREDQAGEPGVVAISESIARRLFAGSDAVGQRVEIDGQPAREIVGVVGDVVETRVRGRALGDLYVPYAQDARPVVEVALRLGAGGDPAGLAQAAQAAVRELDPLQVIERPLTMERVVSEERAGPVLVVGITLAMALLALTLAAIGIYGVVSYSMGQRRRELGIRMALGAPRPALLRVVLARTLLWTAAGVLAGLALALLLVRGLAEAFYLEESPIGLSVALVSTLVVAVAALASWLPARRALGVDPLIALRKGG
jgi:predicted permease